MPAHPPDELDAQIDAFMAHASGPIRPQGRPLNAVEVEIRDRMRARLRAGPVEAVPPPDHGRARGRTSVRSAAPATGKQRQRDDGSVWCQLVTSSSVPPGARQIADDVAHRAAVKLHIADHPHLVWFRHADAATAADLDAGRLSTDDALAFRTAPNVQGFVPINNPMSVFLWADQPPDDLPHVVAHEIRHVWQSYHRRGVYVGQHAEDDADDFARIFR